MAEDTKGTEPEEEESEGGGAGIIGTAVAVGNSKPFSALLGPAFTHLGEHFGKRTKEWVDNLDARRAKNVRTHMDRVKTVEHLSDDAIDPTERQVGLLIEWVEEAKKIDPETEDELSALWQGILGGIYRNDPYADDLVEAIKGLSRKDAYEFLSLDNDHRIRHGSLTLNSTKKLKDLGLIEPFTLRLLIAPLGTTLTLILLMALIYFGSADLAVMFATGHESTGSDTEYRILLKLVSMAFLSVGLGLATFAVAQVGTHRVTELGRRLRASGLRYWKAARTRNERA